MIVRLMLIAVIPAVLLGLASCSREQSDWKTAQAADTIEAYGDFLRKHPDATEATEARARVEQLGEERDWQRASTSDTREAYAQFIAMHPNSKWTQEARIRIENFALGPPAPSAPPGMAGPPAGPAAAPAPVRGPAPLPAPASARSTPAAPALAPAPAAQPARNGASHVVGGPPRHASGAAVAAAAAPGPASGSGQLIQLGAFNSERIAAERWTQLAKKHPELARLKLVTQPVAKGDRTLFRVRTSLPDRSTAQRVCAAVQRGGDACLLVRATG